MDKLEKLKRQQEKRNKQRDKYVNYISKFTDFPVFNYWDVNRKEFKPRALNNLSIKFNWHLGEVVDKEVKKLVEPTEETILNYLAAQIVYATRYTLFGNASFEAGGPNSYCGGNDSIQEQFVCWALNMTPEEYRSGGRSKSYGTELFEAPVLLEWVKNSELYREVKRKLL